MTTCEPEWVAGAWNAECDRCGQKFKSFQLKREWTGLMTCHGRGTRNCWEQRHPQDFVRARPDHPSVQWARGRPIRLMGSEVNRDDL